MCIRLHFSAPIARILKDCRGNIFGRTQLAFMFLFIIVPFAGAQSQPGISELNAPPIVGTLSEGPVRILFIGDRATVGPMSAALSDRIALEYKVFATPTRTEFMDVMARGTDNDRFTELLAEQWDVIWLDFAPNAMPANAREPILGQVAVGAGLVYAGNGDDVKPWATKTGGNSRPLRASFDKTVITELVGSRDNGTIVAINPVDFGNDVSAGRYLFSAMNLLLYVRAGGNELNVIDIGLEGASVAQESIDMMNFRIDLTNDGEPRQLNVRQRYVDEYGNIAFEQAEAFNIAGERSFLLLDYPFLTVGQYSFEVVFADEHGAVAVGGSQFSVTADHYLVDMYPWYAGIPDGGFVPCTLGISKEIEADMRFAAELIDMNGRLIDRTIPAAIPGRKSLNFSLHAVDVPGRAATIRVYYWRSNILVDIMEAPLFIQKSFDPDAFSIVVSDRGMSPLFRTENVRRLNRAGVDWIMSDVCGEPSLEFTYRRGSDILRAGAGIIPYCGAPSVFDDAVAFSVADTLRHFAPPGYIFDAPDGSLSGQDFDIMEHIQSILVSADSTVRTGWSDVRIATMPELEALTEISDLIVLDGDVADRGNAFDVTGALGAHAWHDAITGVDVGRMGAADTLAVHRMLWRSLLSGLNSVWWTPDFTTGNAALMPGGALDPGFAVVAHDVALFNGGMARLILGSEPVALPQWLKITGADGAPAAVMVRMFQDGDTYYLGIVSDASQQGGLAQQLHLDVSGSGAIPSVYDVGTGKFLGITASLQLDITPAGGTVLAFLPSPVRDITIDLSTPIVTPGEMIDATVRVRLRDRASSAGRHVVRIELADPAGVVRAYSRQVLDAPGGSAVIQQFVADNDEPGQWTLRAVDVITGKSVERGVMIRPAARGFGG